jgi:hypothetical protein
MIFGLVYSETVAKFPKAIFAVTAALLVFLLTMLLCVRNPVRPAYYTGRSRSKKGKKNGSRDDVDVERGRSRVRKNLRGGAIIQVGNNYGSVGGSS